MKSFFEKVFFEADDAPPDMAGASPPTGDMSEPPPSPGGDAAPDMGGTDEFGMEDPNGGGGPPDIEEPGEDFGGEGGEENSEENSEEDPANMKFDDKISNVMNMNLYQRFLNMLNSITSQVNTIKDNAEIFNALTKDASDLVPSLQKLDENIRLYLSNFFLNENYSKNLLFFNKCLNEYNLHREFFTKEIKKAMRNVETDV